MTTEEKRALATILLDELAQLQEASPTLLVDVLLADQGHQFILQVLSRRAGMARQVVTVNEHLLKAMTQPAVPSVEQAWNGAAVEE